MQDFGQVTNEADGGAGMGRTWWIFSGLPGGAPVPDRDTPRWSEQGALQSIPAILRNVAQLFESCAGEQRTVPERAVEGRVHTAAGWAPWFDAGDKVHDAGSRIGRQILDRGFEVVMEIPPCWQGCPLSIARDIQRILVAERRRRVHCQVCQRTISDAAGLPSGYVDQQDARIEVTLHARYASHRVVVPVDQWVEGIEHGRHRRILHREVP